MIKNIFRVNPILYCIQKNGMYYALLPTLMGPKLGWSTGTQNAINFSCFDIALQIASLLDGKVIAT